MLLFRECLNINKRKAQLANASNSVPTATEGGSKTEDKNSQPIPNEANSNNKNTATEGETNLPKEEFSIKGKGETLPELCNTFYVEFLDANQFFDLEEKDKNEIIEIIQHFCIWLFKNDYTKSKLSLAKQ